MGVFTPPFSPPNPALGRRGGELNTPWKGRSTDYSVRSGWGPLTMEEATPQSPVVDLARARIERLEAEELRALTGPVGDHLPVELAHRVERLRSERLAIAGGELPPAA